MKIHADLLSYAHVRAQGKDLRVREGRVRDQAQRAEGEARRLENRAKHLLETVQTPVSLTLDDGRLVTLWMAGTSLQWVVSEMVEVEGVGATVRSLGGSA